MSEEPKKPCMLVEAVLNCGDGTYKQVTLPIHDKEIADTIRDGRYHGHSCFSMSARNVDAAPPPHVLFDRVELDTMLLHSLPAGIHVVDQRVTHGAEQNVRPSLKDLFVKQQDTTLVHSSYPPHWEDELRAQVMADCHYMVNIMDHASLKPKTLPNGVVIMRMKLPRKLKKRLRRRFRL